MPDETAAPVPVKSVVSGTWKEMIVRWFYEQSVSTILLVGILTAIVYGIPTYVLPSVKEGYKTNTDQHEKVMRYLIDANERQTKMIMDGHDRDREMFERAMRIGRE